MAEKKKSSLKKPKEVRRSDKTSVSKKSPALQNKDSKNLGKTIHEQRGSVTKLKRQKIEDGIAQLASFPELNPIPIVEIGLMGQVLYLNPAVKQLFPDLQTAGLQHPWLAGLKSLSEMLDRERKSSHVREVKIGENWYEQTIYPVLEGKRLRIYGFDITARKRAEEALHEKEKDLNRAQAVAHTGSWRLDIRRNELLWSDETYRIFGIIKGTPLTYEAFLATVHPDDRQMVDQSWQAALRGEPYDIEHRILVEGNIKWVRERAELEFDKKGSLQGGFGTVQDITERKRAEEELRRSHAELEIRVQERTAELMNAVEELQDEMSERKRIEEALIEQSRILEGFFISTITPLVFLDKDFNFIRVNEAYAKACQREISEFPGHNHFEFYPSNAKKIFEQVVETKTPYKAIARPFSFPDHPERGTTYWNWTLTPLLDEMGKVEFLVFSLEDMTERKRAEEAVKAERQRFNDVLEILPAYLVLLTPDHHVPFANRFFRERFGESHGRRCFEYLFDRSGPCEVCETYTVMKTKEPHQWEWTGPDSRNYDVFDFPFTDSDGSPLILEMGIDITDRKKAEEALRASSLYARSLIEASPDPLVTISSEGKVTDVNSATELATGVSRDQLIGSDFSDYFTEPEKAREGYRTVFLKGNVRDYPLSIRHTSGRITDVLYNATLYRNEVGEVQGIFAAARDVTELNEIERRTRATNALLNLFAKKSSRKEYLDGALELIQDWCGCRCAGIRVLDQQGNIPYESYSGFSREFWESENFLSVKNDQCVCIRVITDEIDPQDAPVITPTGSFCCANTVKFIRQLSEEEKKRYRSVCVENGFLSVAVIPISYGERILGAIHLADETENRVSFKSLEFIESMSPLIGEAINRFNLEDEIRESENRLRHLSSQLLTVQENERRSIARELHDGIGQILTAVKFKVESTLQEMGEGRPKKKPLEDIIPMIKESIEEVRRIQMDLRPSTLDDLGILATLEWFCREYQKIYSHIHIEKKIDLQESEVSIPLKTAIYRVMQEAMNNIAKHSKADLVHLSLGKREDKIQLIIQDNGQGFNFEEILSPDRSRRGMGFSSMQERVELSGGSFTIESIKGKGTVIRASWPLEQK